MESTTHCPLFYSRYDLTWGPRRERIAPPPYQKLIFEVTITDWNIEPEGLFGFQSYVVYRISTVYRKFDSSIAESITYKRYHDFVSLYEKLEEKYGWVRLPLLPPKRFIGNLNSNFITRRKYHLEQFLENLVCWRDNDPDVVAFLGLDESNIITERRPRDKQQVRSCLRTISTSRPKNIRSVSWRLDTND